MHQILYCLGAADNGFQQPAWILGYKISRPDFEPFDAMKPPQALHRREDRRPQLTVLNLTVIVRDAVRSSSPNLKSHVASALENLKQRGSDT
jgi:hypothetical protein